MNKIIWGIKAIHNNRIEFDKIFECPKYFIKCERLFSIEKWYEHYKISKERENFFINSIANWSHGFIPAIIGSKKDDWKREFALRNTDFNFENYYKPIALRIDKDSGNIFIKIKDRKHSLTVN